MSNMVTRMRDAMEIITGAVAIGALWLATIWLFAILDMALT